ncbi:MAG: Dolichyl-monophosphooligosaccharide--protein glycosyltransferase AglB [Methanocella sp. PtaU1.Bin125]|nr:MAG: Dolichyl-monophosphooligosaccharide--protein glycosyltransferase AglB [Methanocella sp. PtaU1.Bin125]
MSPSKKKHGKQKASRQKPVTAPPQEAATPSVAAAAPAARTVTAADRPSESTAPARAPFLRAPAAPVLVLLGILAVALAIRLLPLLYCIKDGHILLYDQDSYYHLRRITSIVENFPAVNIYDSYVNYPDGYFIGWPPLYDFTAALASLVLGLGNPGTLVTEVAASAVNVTIGLLGIAAAFFLARDVFGEKAALAGAFVMAILPATAFMTGFAYVGHHSLEMLVSLTMYLLFLRGVTRGKAQGLTFSSIRSGKGPVVYAALAGVATAAAILSWDGAPFFIGTIIAFAFLQYALDARRGEGSEYLTVAGIVAAVTALAFILPFVVTSYYGQRFEIIALYMSWFHVIMLVGFGAFFAFMGAVVAAAKKTKAPWPAVPIAAIVTGAIALAATSVLLPQLFDNLVAGLTFLSGGSTVLSSISEVSPLLYVNGQFSLAAVWTYFGTALLIAVVGLVAYLFALRKTPVGPAVVFFLTWTAIVAVMNLMQQRFVYLLGINVALLAGYGIWYAARQAGLDRPAGAVDGKRGKRTGAGSRPRLTTGLAVAAIASVVLLLQPLAYACIINTTPLTVTGNWDDAAAWIKENTPATSYTYSADIGTMPEYGVMTWWDYGNYILYRGERPAVSNNFQTGIDASANFFLASSEPLADRIMDACKAKYVAVDYLMGSASIGIPGVFDSMATLAGENASSYFMTFRRLDPASGGTALFVDGNNKYYGSMYSRLYNDRGLGGQDPLGNVTSGLRHYRMVYANEGADPVVVFEKVPGAVITGNAPPGSRVTLTLNVSWGDGSRDYCSYATADQDGAYRFTVPYATGAAAGPVTTGAHYVVSAGGAKTDVSVTEDAVQKGTTIAAGGLQ